MSIVDPEPAEMDSEDIPPEGAEMIKKKKKKKKLSKAEKQERKRKREIRVKCKVIRADFARELELARKMAKVLNAEWINVMREIKLVELKKELVAWEQKAMTQIIEKDQKIQALLAFITVQQEMSLSVTAQLKEIFEYATDVYKALTDGNRALYEQTANELVYDFYKELFDRRDYDNAQRMYCENVMHTTNTYFIHTLLDEYDVFLTRRNSNTNAEIEKRYILRDGVVQKMKASQQQLVDFVAELTSCELDPRKYEKIRKLMNRQRNFIVTSDRLSEVISQKSIISFNLKNELLQLELTSQKKINDLRTEHSYFFQIRRALENKMKKDEHLTMEKVRVATTESYVVLKHFKKLVRFGELLLSIAANVRKYQTQAEKVVSFDNFALSGDNSEMEDLREFMLTVVDPVEFFDRSEKEMCYEINSMRFFWRRVAVVEAQKEMLKKEKARLLAENKIYTDFICSLSTRAEPGNLCKQVILRKIPQALPKPSDSACLK